MDVPSADGGATTGDVVELVSGVVGGVVGVFVVGVPAGTLVAGWLGVTALSVVPQPAPSKAAATTKQAAKGRYFCGVI